MAVATSGILFTSGQQIIAQLKASHSYVIVKARGQCGNYMIQPYHLASAFCKDDT